MKKLILPAVTLICVETFEHKLAKLAIEDCLNVVDFADVVILSDCFDELRIPGARYVQVEKGYDKLTGYTEHIIYKAPPHIHTSHALSIQWDSWVIHPDLWTDEFLKYDYLGCPWPQSPDGGFHADKVFVGSSGISLRSKEFYDFVAENKKDIPIFDAQEDTLLTFTYREFLETVGGFKYCPIDVAYKFGSDLIFYEYPGCPLGSPKSFGFHGICNWPRVLEKDRLIERYKLAKESEYIKTKFFVDHPSKMEFLLQCAPWLNSI